MRESENKVKVQFQKMNNTHKAYRGGINDPLNKFRKEAGKNEKNY